MPGMTEWPGRCPAGAAQPAGSDFLPGMLQLPCPGRARLMEGGVGWGVGLPSSQSTPSALSCPYLFCLWSLGAPPGPGALALSSPRPLQPACGLITALLPHPLWGHSGLQARGTLGLTAHTLTPKWLLTWAVEGGGGAFSRAGLVGLEGALGAAGFGELAPGWHLPGGCCALVWLQRAPALP